MSAAASTVRKSASPTPLAHQAIHDTVVDILKDQPRGTLLDVPAGEGALAARLIDLGFDVRCCDLYPEIFRLEGVDIAHGNLDAELPFSDRSFDYVTCLEGLEHIENPQQAMREFARVLKPGGHLVVSVPNILNIEERLKWLLYGYTSHFKPISRAAANRLRAEYNERVEIAAHVNPIAYSELRYILEKNGFEMVNTHRDKFKTKAWLYWPIVAVLKVLAKLTPKQKRSERWTEELASKEVLMGGNTLIVHAVLGIVTAN
ncbi:MAG TPA: methyltransferase domain-containing protein [Pyrinomonadaceae bacterium]|jgi:ubiquinone/menaquinone biosynthesis C-methylase UbiE|nr:methyltransferase domain-containing protein [Pyrinomonadaceae bacterium]